MKKVSLLLSTLGGALAGYLFSKKELREQLASAKTPEAAAKLLGKQLQQDGAALAGHVREFVQSPEVQDNLAAAKKFTLQKAQEARVELRRLIEQGKSSLQKELPGLKKKAKKTARTVVAKAKKAIQR